MTEFGCGAFRSDLMYAGLKVAKAWTMLHDVDTVKHLNTEAIMQLHRDAGYSEDAVQDAGNKWYNMRLDKGLEP